MKKRYKKIVKEKLNETFGDCLLVIDEARNVRINGGEGRQKNRKVYSTADYTCEKEQNTFYTGTPMYNDSREIIFY